MNAFNINLFVINYTFYNKFLLTFKIHLTALTLITNNLITLQFCINTNTHTELFLSASKLQLYKRGG